MKRAGVFIIMWVLVTATAAQQPGQQSQPSGQANAQPGAAPQGKRPPQAKTQQEFDAYKAAVANQTDAAAMEKAADDFAAKFPNSELRPLLYTTAMRLYQNANNPDKMLETAQKLLKVDPDNPEALVNSAEVIVEHTHDTDLDKEQHWDEAAKNAQHALETVETDLPAGMQPNQIDLYKGLVRSNAYSILGSVSDSREKYADAEGYYRKSIDALPSQPDAVVILRLALALDKQAKYPEALKEANRAVDLLPDTTTTGKQARQERDRLVQLTGGGSPPGASAPAAGSAQPPH